MTTINREWLNDIRNQFCDVGQGHVFTWWDDLSSKERERLFHQLSSIDLELLKRLIEENLTNKSSAEDREIEPAKIIHLPTSAREETGRDRTRDAGEDVIRAGKCAVFVVAGSTGSMLGSQGIKGKYPITPVKGKSLFQFHTEKVLALRRKYNARIPFFVMTSTDNYEETRTFFEDNNFFGLTGEDIFFFSQGMLPAVGRSGKLIMENKGSLHMCPDGHGGSIRSLYNSGALEEMEERGIQYIFYFQVDNPLCRIMDPLFVGLHHNAGAEISSKVVRKRNPEEKLGVLGKINGSLGVVEYSDLTKGEMYARDDKGDLKFYAGNIATHIINVAFVRKLSQSDFRLAFHKSELEIDHIDEKGNPVEGNGNSAFRFESFVFDALQYAGNSISLEVVREEEFSPLKNMEGEDSPQVCQAMLTENYSAWLRKAGFRVEGESEARVEISPLFALDAEEFCRRVKEEGKIFSDRFFVE